MSEQDMLDPYWDDCDTAIAMSSSNEYAPYLGVYLTSIVEHYNATKKYDIVIFNRDISEENKRRLQDILGSRENMHLRFANPIGLFRDINLYITHPLFKEENYFRIAAPLILANYQKIIFTDIDLIALDDISKLGEIDMEGQVIAACVEPCWEELYITNQLVMGQRIKEYTDNVLCLPSPTDYYNTGVAVFDVKRFNQMNVFEKLKETINDNHLIYIEQDALNKCLFGHFYRLPVEWNYEFLKAIRFKYNQYDFYREYRSHEKDAKITHFLGSIKPWRNPMEYRGDLWWSYASRTPFFAEILASLVDLKVQIALKPTVSTAHTASTTAQSAVETANAAVVAAKTGVNTANEAVKTLNHTTQLAYVSSHLLSFRWKKWRYQVKKTLLSGNKRSKYLNKYRSVRELIKEAERFRKKMSGG